MTYGVIKDAPREAPAYYDIEGGTKFATAMTEGGGLREEEEGGGGAIVWTATTKTAEDGVGWGAARAPLSSASPPPWRWSVRHLGTPAEDAVVGGDVGPLSRGGEGASAAR